MNEDNLYSGRRSELQQAIAYCRSSFGTIFGFSMLTNLLMLAFPVYMLQVYDRVLTTSHTDTLLMLTVIVGGALLLMASIDGLRSTLALRIGGWLTDQLGPIFLASNVRAQLRGERSFTNSLGDLTVLRNFISTQGLTFFCDAPWVPVYVAIIWVIHPTLGFLALTAALLLLALSFINEYMTRDLLQSASHTNISARRDCDAAIRNSEVVSAMGMLPNLVERWQVHQRSVLEDLRYAGERSGFLVAATKFLRLFAQVGVLGLGALLVIRGELTAGAMIACSILLGRALAPVEMAMGAWKNFTQARLAYRSLSEQLAAFPTPAKRTQLPPPQGEVNVKQLTHVSGSRRILDKVSFDLKPGEALAIIGPSAAGKSTLCRFLVGLSEPSDGEVSLDGSNIGHWDREQLGRFLGFLPQNVELFAGTIKENIARMGVGDDDDVLAAGKLAHAHNMIQQLPDGYDTLIGDGGVGLSGGQQQRIGLARALYGTPKLIVLDEPNANLDQAGESALAAAIRELKARGCTIVMVGHRPSTLAEASKILLLKDGQVQLFGPREEVLERLREASRTRMAAADETEGTDDEIKEPGKATV